ncbi:hypothetical protein KCP69_23230 [Salmonella enterica subsp. enterica]|nr:hypothetical protein KCP69_23230 [Salmonella enterica subsp. enterica]
MSQHAVSAVDHLFSGAAAVSAIACGVWRRGSWQHMGGVTADGYSAAVLKRR